MPFTMRATGLGEADRDPVALLLLDVDGTVRRGGPGEPFVNGPGDVEVYPEAVARIIAWRAAGGRVALVSNQGGIGAGNVDAAAVGAALHETVRQLSGPEEGGRIDVVVFCGHAESDGCWCRKPAPGLLFIAAEALVFEHLSEYYPADQMLMVGDMDSDREAARRAGVRFMDAAEWRAEA